MATVTNEPPDSKARTNDSKASAKWRDALHVATQIAQLFGTLSIAFAGYQLFLMREQIAQTNTQIEQTNKQIKQSNDQIELSTKELRQAATWNRVTATLAEVNDEQFNKLRLGLQAALHKIGINYNGRQVAFDKDERTKIMGSAEAKEACALYLNHLEHFSSAINRNVYDDDLSYRTKVMWIVKAYRVFEPVVMQMRDDYHNRLVYVELETLGKKWGEKYDKEQQPNRINAPPITP